MTGFKKKLRALIPFPKRKTLRKWFPSFETRNITHLIMASGADCIIDVGGNMGQYVERLRATGCKLPAISFEPVGECHAALSTKAAKDGNWIIAPRIALGETDSGTTTIFKLRDTSLSSRLTPLRSDGRADIIDVMDREDVPMRTLDAALPTLIKTERPFVKIDVQGTEESVIAGASAILAKAVGVQIELGFNPLYKGENSYLTLLNTLDALGFYPVYIAPVLSRQKLGPISQIDMVLYRRA